MRRKSWDAMIAESAKEPYSGRYPLHTRAIGYTRRF
jgi:hypothetical protein